MFKFSRWKKIDIFLAALFILTNLSFFLFSNEVFKLFLWALIVVGVVRLLLLIKRKLFWKIRNRLIFSGLFLVATPLMFISVFFFLIGNIIITQYGSFTFENLLNERMTKIEEIARTHVQDASTMPIFIMSRYSQFNLPDITGITWEKRGNTYKTSYKHPNLDQHKKIKAQEFKGFFMIDHKLYQGTLKIGEERAILVALEINQKNLDSLSTYISDFRIKYINPKSKEKPLLDTDFFILPFAYEYPYLDFDTLDENSRPKERMGEFWLYSSSEQVIKTIKAAISSSPEGHPRKMIFFLFVLFAVFTIISFWIGFRMVRVITRSVNQLTSGTKRIRNGDFSFRIKTKSRDQMQYLAESFNEMAAGIDRLLIDEKEKQRLEEELRIARSIQLKLLPDESFTTDLFEIAAINIPATEIAGDYFDYFYKENNYLSLLVADVSGKGTSAAFYMAELKGVINHLQRELMSPASLIAECHESLKDSFDKVTFITITMAQFRILEQKFIIARAGHTHAIYYEAEVGKCRELAPAGMAIGLINFSSKRIEEIEVNYQKGDVLFLFSDGLSELMNEEEEMLGTLRLKRIIEENHLISAQEMKQKILDLSIEFSENGINRDDLTFIILKVVG